MTEARKTRQKPREVPARQGLVNVTSIKLEPLEAASAYYINYIEVAHSTHDFTLICARMPSKLSEEKASDINKSGVLVIEPELQLIVPTTLIPSLIRALTIQKEQYEKLFGVQIKEIGAQNEQSGS